MVTKEILLKFKRAYIQNRLHNLDRAISSSFWEEKSLASKHKIWDKKRIYFKKIGFGIGDNVTIDSGFEFVRNSGIEIGERSSIGKNFKCYNFGDVVIGKFCMFAAEVQISNGSHHTDSLIPYSGKLAIGNGVWIGHGAKIVGTDIIVGDNAIIGAGSLVLKSVKENEIVAGVPAKKIGMRAPSDEVWNLGGNFYSSKTFNLILK